MSESSILLEHVEDQVQQVMSDRGKWIGSRVTLVQCFVQECSKKVRKLRLHIRKFHEELCPLSCSTCAAKFVGPIDLSNHERNGCPRRELAFVRSASVRLRSKEIETFFKNVDFSDSSKVDDFIAKSLQLDLQKDFSQDVDQLCQHLQHNLQSFNVNKIVKGGSVEKGTALKDKADIDCVVFLNNVKTMEEHKLNLQETKNCLESCLKQSPYKDQITFDEQTPFAVKFKLRLNTREFHIDLLPTFTTDQSPEQLYNEMFRCTTKDKGYYSAQFVSLQVEFVKGQPSNVKNLIRLVKYWRKTWIKHVSSGTARLPSSYPLELITIGCWEKAGKPSSFDIRAGFKAVLQRLINSCDIHFISYKNYNEAIAKRGIKGTDSKSLPFVLDPANPTNNVCSASNAEGWETVADVAKMTLRRQPLKHVTFNKNWQIRYV